ncbi:MAG: hypothetical protein KF886_07015 [Candidatus Hydrogenedentes bacterium]|nr:hypothetical protein [Candidatus Hydrogenedentota bacterium]
MHRFSFLLATLFLLTGGSRAAGDSPEPTIRAGVYNVDVSPPIGSPVAYAPAREIVDPLSARGIVLLGAGDPIVLCAVDFIGIGNEGYDAWRRALAEAAGTSPGRVALHALHQHDGCRCDFGAERLLAEHGLGGRWFDEPFLRDAIARTAAAVREAAAGARPVTHAGFGRGKVEKVASNRRILGEDGKVKIVRFSRTSDPEAIAAPEGLVDPWLKSVSLWDGEDPVAVLTYYATHPQSYYGKGDVTCEFPGLARNAREARTGVPHIHFTGAAGNIAAGKYNDGSPENRPVLAARMEAGMEAAWQATEKTPIRAGDIEWRSRNIQLPIAPHLDEGSLRATLANPDAEDKARFSAALKLAWIGRTNAAAGIDLTALRLGAIWLLGLPGESFVEYQLAAQDMRPGDRVCTAAYADYGPGYIGTEIAYTQGGYETGKNASSVAPEVEGVLLEGIRRLLE